MGGNERRYVEQAFDSNYIAPLGPMVDAFEARMQQMLDIPHAAALSAGTGALHLALINLGVGAGDFVICSDLTFAASANVIRYLGATPVFIDCDEATWNMDPDLLAQELEARSRNGSLPKAVIVVDLYGQPADFDRILPVCQRFGVPVVEDAAEALGATYRGRYAGGFGVMGALSFNGNKIITTSGGGMLLSHHKPYIDHARFLATQARDPAPHYQHSRLGYNYRMSNLLAAVGLGQMEVLMQRVERKRAINALYRELLRDIPGLTFMPEGPGCRSTFWLTCVTLDRKALGVGPEDIRLHLESVNIESRPVWKPMHLQPYYQDAPVRQREVGRRLFEDGLCLPSGTAMTDDEVAMVVGHLRETPGLAGV